MSTTEALIFHGRVSGNIVTLDEDASALDGQAVVLQLTKVTTDAGS